MKLIQLVILAMVFIAVAAIKECGRPRPKNITSKAVDLIGKVRDSKHPKVARGNIRHKREVKFEDRSRAFSPVNMS
uniref:Uncharacterized protein n=1 Tax=Panagrellus redivivus TaxID=6233 RepID=A0A7E4UTZ4_PANRE